MDKDKELTLEATLKDLLEADYKVVRPWLGQLLKKHLGVLGETLLPVVDGIKDKLEAKL